jgi:uncharacterized protein YraI
MRKLMLAVIAGCMSAAVAGAYAAQGSPADTDKAGRAGPGTSAGEMGAAKPGTTTPGSTSGSGMGTSKGGSSTTGAASSTTGGSSSAGSTSGSSGAAAGSSTGTDDTKGRRSRRAARAEKG